jgi:hypothetical protein
MVSFEDVVARIGTMPIGDPVAMRQHASLVETEAEQLAARAAAMTAAIVRTVYECAAADRLRGGADDVNRRLLAAAERLRTLAASLRVAATRLEEQQTFWRQEFARVEHALQTRFSH